MSDEICPNAIKFIQQLLYCIVVALCGMVHRYCAYWKFCLRYIVVIIKQPSVIEQFPIYYYYVL